eukprot:6479277-Amphidinium_carterae.1
MERSDWSLRYTWSLPQIALALLPMLERANKKVEAVLHMERDAAETEGISRNEWAAMLHSNWRKLARTPSFSIGSTELAAAERHYTSEEAAMLADYWAGVFHQQEPRPPSTPLEDYVVRLPWHEIELTPEDFASAIARAACTTPGPDGISYGHLKGIAQQLG